MPGGIQAKKISTSERISVICNTQGALLVDTSGGQMRQYLQFNDPSPYAQVGNKILESLPPDAQLTIDRYTIEALEAPTGADILINLQKLGVGVGVISLLAGTTNRSLSLTSAISYTTTDTIGLEYTQVGSGAGAPGGGIKVILHAKNI